MFCLFVKEDIDPMSLHDLLHLPILILSYKVKNSTNEEVSMKLSMPRSTVSLICHVFIKEWRNKKWLATNRGCWSQKKKMSILDSWRSGSSLPGAETDRDTVNQLCRLTGAAKTGKEEEFGMICGSTPSKRHCSSGQYGKSPKKSVKPIREAAYVNNMRFGMKEEDR